MCSLICLLWISFNLSEKQGIQSFTHLEIAATQVALDNAGFSPGCIDGRLGPKTKTALSLAEEAGYTIQISYQPWVSWTIPEKFFADVSRLPETWFKRSKISFLSFETPIEKVAELFHASEEFLRILNPSVRDWRRLREGNALQVPAFSPRRMPHADRLEIFLSQKAVIARDRENRLLASFPCSIAAKKEKRPIGSLVIKVLAPNPDYLFDPFLFPELPESSEITGKLMIPPGPNNPVGTMWIGLAPNPENLALKGLGIHGTPKPEDIGKTESHGCFRLTNWDAQRLATMIRIETPVLVKE